MQISRSTLRQALGVLTSSGHLVAIRGRSGGTFVADSPPVVYGAEDGLLKRYEEIINYRLVIEMGAATLAAETASDAAIDELEEALEGQRRLSPDDAIGYVRGDAAFHLALGRAPGNQRLERSMTEIQGDSMELIVARIRAQGLPIDLLRESVRQHEQILEAIRAHDPQRAGGLMREHMRLFGAAMAAIGG
jgi:GntR family transcriptional regulator, transcriptional repressor for pyruvate dehydrogenase complex